MKKRYLVVIILGLLFLPNVLGKIDQESLTIGNYLVTGHFDQPDLIKQAIPVYLDNIQAVNQENTPAYLETILPSARMASKEVFESSTRQFDLSISLQSIEVVYQDPTLIKLRVKQINENNNDQDYRDHLATLGVTLKLEGTKWYIVEAMVENTEFDYTKEASL